MCKKEKLFRSESLCLQCNAYKNERTAQYRENNREEYNNYQNLLLKRLRNERRKLGKCTKCGRDKNDSRFLTCPICRDKDRNRALQRKII